LTTTIENPSIEEITSQIEADRPKTPPALLSHAERTLLTERAFLGLYRWYVDRSQTHRNWLPDRDIAWRGARHDHAPEIVEILVGFFAVEQYTPDYVGQILNMLRKSHGRSQFLLRWGAEEEKHSDLWRNALLFTRARSREWLEEYMGALRNNMWTVNFDDPLRMLFYQIIQERATQVNYLNFGNLVRGENGASMEHHDPVLQDAARIISIDEGAHYQFFLETARVFLYYFPVESIEALADVLKFFAMPAMDIIPDYNKFGEALYATAIYGPRIFAKDVVQIALDKLGFEGRKAVETGVRRSREVPDTDGQMRDSAIFGSLNYDYIEAATKRLFTRIHKYEAKYGLNLVASTDFVPTAPPVGPDRFQ
jgi:acyl-[acyl-carrier-protein] desaturase